MSVMLSSSATNVVAVAGLVTEGIMGSNLLECEVLEISTATGEQQCQDCVYPDCTECDPCPTGADFPDFYVSPQHTLDCATDRIFGVPFKAFIHFMAKPTSTAFVRLFLANLSPQFQ